MVANKNFKRILNICSERVIWFIPSDEHLKIYCHYRLYMKGEETLVCHSANP